MFDGDEIACRLFHGFVDYSETSTWVVSAAASGSIEMRPLTAELLEHVVVVGHCGFSKGGRHLVKGVADASCDLHSRFETCTAIGARA